MEIRYDNGIMILGKGSPEEGEEFVAIPCASGGWIVIETGGMDYGSWVERVFRLTNMQYQEFELLPNSQAASWLRDQFPR